MKMKIKRQVQKECTEKIFFLKSNIKIFKKEKSS